MPTQTPYTREQIEAEFQRQSQWDRSGLNLSAPQPGSYDVRVGGLIPAMLRMQAVGTNVVFSTYGSLDLPTLAHELRHVAQVQTLGVVPFAVEYTTILPEQAASVTVTAAAADFRSGNVKSPARCTAVLAATTDVMGNVEPDTSNDAIHLVVDVVDRNDH